MRKLALASPAHPERLCWGCDKLCRGDDRSCGEDTVRVPHPCELFGDDWMEWAEQNGAAPLLARLAEEAERQSGKPSAD